MQKGSQYQCGTCNIVVECPLTEVQWAITQIGGFAYRLVALRLLAASIILYAKNEFAADGAYLNRFELDDSLNYYGTYLKKLAGERRSLKRSDENQPRECNREVLRLEGELVIVKVQDELLMYT